MNEARKYALAWLGEHTVYWEAFEKAGHWTPPELLRHSSFDRPRDADAAHEAIRLEVATQAEVPASTVVLLVRP
jgi:hypothetical protein